MKILGIVILSLMVVTGVLGSEKHDPRIVKYDLSNGVWAIEFCTTTGNQCLAVLGNGVALHCFPLGGM